MSEDVRDAGYDDWLDAVDAGEGYYLVCDEGHTSLPPRSVCPECGRTELTEADLPEVGEVETTTNVTVATPSFGDDAPYVTAVADFGPVRLTGVMPDTPYDEIDPGFEVVASVGRRETNGERMLVFEPR